MKFYVEMKSVPGTNQSNFTGGLNQNSYQEFLNPYPNHVHTAAAVLSLLHLPRSSTIVGKDLHCPSPLTFWRTTLCSHCDLP